MCDGLEQNKIVRVDKNSGSVLSRLWTKVNEIWGQRSKSFVLSKALARSRLSIRHVSFNRYSLLSLKVVKNRTNVKVFGPQFASGGMTLTFLRQTVSAIYCTPVVEVWLSSVC